MVKLLCCALLPLVVVAQNHCIGGSFQLTVDNSVEADAWMTSMKAAVIALAGDVVNPDDVEVAVSYGGEPAAGSCADRYDAIAPAPAPAAASPAAMRGTAPAPAPVVPASPAGGNTTASAGNGTAASPAASGNASAPAANASAPAPAPAAFASGNESAPAASGNASASGNVPAPSNASSTSPAPASNASAPSSGPASRLLAPAEATANVAYTVVANESVIAAASTALAAVDDAALTAAIETAVAADTDLPANAFSGIVEGSMMTPTTPEAQPSPSTSLPGGESAAFHPSLSLLGVAVAAGSLLV